MAAKRVTIQDIADALGLSRNTVSKVLNNSEGPADATRERVLQKALEMGYKQFAYAASVLQLGGDSPLGAPGILGDKTEVALLSTTYLSAPHFSSLMLDAIQNELSQLGYTLNTHRVTQECLAEGILPSTFDASRVAAILCVEMFDRDYDRMLCGLEIPVLFVDGPAQLDGRKLPADMLIMENVSQVTLLMNDMIAKGVRRIGFVGNWEHCQSFYERYSAFRLAMLMAEIPVEPELCIRENYFEGILGRLDELPELLVCANDFVALDTMQALRAMGTNVPEDILVAGFDDSAESRRSVPPLTTIHIHTQVMAYTAIEMLRTRIKEPSLDFRTVYTETELIYRESTELPAERA